jgi:hypothetical protein
MLVTPRCSVRTVRPATTVANHRKLRGRENAGRSSQIAFHQATQSAMAVSRLMLTAQYSMYMLYA